jgi:hypothetical protein
MRRMNARKWIAVLLPALALTPLAARAAEVDTQFIFGFTMGADVGELGEKEIESQTVGRFGKSGGSYTALETQLRAEFTPTENTRIEMGFPVARPDDVRQSLEDHGYLGRLWRSGRRPCRRYSWLTRPQKVRAPSGTIEVDVQFLT